MYTYGTPYLHLQPCRSWTLPSCKALLPIDWLLCVLVSLQVLARPDSFDVAVTTYEMVTSAEFGRPIQSTIVSDNNADCFACLSGVPVV